MTRSGVPPKSANAAWAFSGRAMGTEQVHGRGTVPPRVKSPE